MLDIRQVEHEVLHPERRALTNGGRLCGLQMCRPERGLGAPLTGERRERAENEKNLAAEQLESAAHEDQVSVVCDVGARSAIVNEPTRRRRRVAEGVNVRHDVVPEASLIDDDGLKVDVV